MITSQFWGAADEGDLGEPIEQSLRFRNSQRLVSSDTMPTGDWTFSFWYKPGEQYGDSSRDAILTFAPNMSYQMGNASYGADTIRLFYDCKPAVSGSVESLLTAP